METSDSSAGAGGDTTFPYFEPPCPSSRRLRIIQESYSALLHPKEHDGKQGSSKPPKGHVGRGQCILDLRDGMTDLKSPHSRSRHASSKSSFSSSSSQRGTHEEALQGGLSSIKGPKEANNDASASDTDSQATDPILQELDRMQHDLSLSTAPTPGHACDNVPSLHPWEEEAISSIEGHGDQNDDDHPEGDFSMLLEPDTRPITSEQLVNEVKGIYAGLVMVEKKCVEITTNRAQGGRKLSNEQWQALIALHRTLLHEHHDFYLAAKHPAASPALRHLAHKYAMPARMWRDGIHAFLDLLHTQLPTTHDHMLSFVYIAYSALSQMMFAVPEESQTWKMMMHQLKVYAKELRDDIARATSLTAADKFMDWITDADCGIDFGDKFYRHFGNLNPFNPALESKKAAARGYEAPPAHVVNVLCGWMLRARRVSPDGNKDNFDIYCKVFQFMCLVAKNYNYWASWRAYAPASWVQSYENSKIREALAWDWHTTIDDDEERASWESIGGMSSDEAISAGSSWNPEQMENEEADLLPWHLRFANSNAQISSSPIGTLLSENESRGEPSTKRRAQQRNWVGLSDITEDEIQFDWKAWEKDFKDWL